jgi:hypothetical protein
MAQVTRLPHDGRMIMGGKGVIIPFHPEKKPDDAHTPLDDPEPLMKGARDAYERQAMELAADPPSMRQQAESDANQAHNDEGS